MADADLEEIRRARLAQLQQQAGSGGGGGGGGSGGFSDGGGQDDERKKQEADARAHILAQILEPEAADRLGRIRLVKETRATDVENRLIMLARSGQLRGKVTETDLKKLLGSLSEHERENEGGGRIIVHRKGGWDDDDDLDDL